MISMSYGLMSEITRKLYELNYPKAETNKFYVCVLNDKKQKVCFYTPRNDSIICERDNNSNDKKKICQINLRTPRGDLMNKFPKSIFTNIEPGENGMERTYFYLGTFDKSELESIKNMIGTNINYDEQDKIKISLGYTDPPKNCAWKFWKDECRAYIDSDEWKLDTSIKPPFLKLVKKEE